MADPVEVAIESALLNRAQSYATSQSLTIALPNVITTPPVATPTAKWLQAFFLPAPTAGLGISPNSTNQHYGIFQISVYYGLGSGELAPPVSPPASSRISSLAPKSPRTASSPNLEASVSRAVPSTTAHGCAFP
jgi:hypothetical protein